MAQPVLDLDTVIDRAPVRIDGKIYEMLNPAELSILDLHRFGAGGHALAGMGAAGEMTDEQMLVVSATLDRMVRIILRAPDDVHAKLTDVHRFRIVNAFNGLTLNTPPAAVVSEPPRPAAGVPEPPPPTEPLPTPAPPALEAEPLPTPPIPAS